MPRVAGETELGRPPKKMGTELAVVITRNTSMEVKVEQVIPKERRKRLIFLITHLSNVHHYFVTLLQSVMQTCSAAIW